MNNLFAKRIEAGDFIITAEYLPGTNLNGIPIEELKESGAVAINISDNPYGPIISSLASAVKLQRADIEPILQIVTRDRNRIALQSDILGAVSLGVNNIHLITA
jgi:methylenetetrahydrofolate reductase (NADPH)